MKVMRRRMPPRSRAGRVSSQSARVALSISAGPNGAVFPETSMRSGRAGAECTEVSAAVRRRRDQARRRCDHERPRRHGGVSPPRSAGPSRKARSRMVFLFAAAAKYPLCFPLSEFAPTRATRTRADRSRGSISDVVGARRGVGASLSPPQ